MIDFKKPRRKVDRVFIHCSASDHVNHDNVATMRRWHLARGWSDVGYHYFIRKDGTVEEGRPIRRVPSAQRGHNSGTIAICLHGLKKNRFTEKQFDSLRTLCSSINHAYKRDITFHGHKEVSNKSCPVFDYKSVLGLGKYGYMGRPPVNPDIATERRATIKRGSRGLGVIELQQILSLKDDGYFGPRTARAVKAFQKKHSLTADGIVGPMTWAKLIED